MAETSFFASRAMECALVEAALTNGIVLIPDLNFSTRELINIDSIDMFKNYREKCRKFFLTSLAYAESPLEVRSVKKGAKAMYYIFPKAGGPMIDLSLPTLFLEGGRPAMRAGSLSYYRRYESSILKINLPAPGPLKSAYKFLVDMLARSSEKLKGNKGCYFLEKALKPGVAEIRLAEDLVVFNADADRNGIIRP
jgi:hypothetical protein